MVAPSIVQQKSGVGTVSGGATVLPAFDNPVQPDHTVILAYAVSAAPSVPPAGFVLDYSPSTTPVMAWYRLPKTVGTEQSFSVTNVIALDTLWCLWETTQLDAFTALDEQAFTTSFKPATNVDTLSSGTTPGVTGTVDTINFAIHHLNATVWTGTFAQWYNHTNGFGSVESTIIQNIVQSPGTSSANVAGFSSRVSDVAGPFSTTATLSTDSTRSSASDNFAASIVSYRGVNTNLVTPGKLL